MNTMMKIIGIRKGASVANQNPKPEGDPTRIFTVFNFSLSTPRFERLSERDEFASFFEKLAGVVDA
jgi:hypothetical protein